ncbi:uncharacterized protein LOC134292957 [Anolis carolinensis]|uniref:uncharacterized protein LOC134292957 n=1 Tax=Anolis carolinensis TaxID=28377 RepID=UPI002F2B2C3D
MSGENLSITEIQQYAKQQQTCPPDFVTKQCLLTVDTVVSIFEHLKKITKQLELLKLSFDSLVQKNTALKESPAQWSAQSPEPRKVDRGHSAVPTKELQKESCNRILQARQTMLQIANIRVNKGRWGSQRAIKTSLSQLLHIQPHSIDILKVEWLPQVAAGKRILLTFQQPTIPTMLMKMRIFLHNFQISPTRVFRDLDITPLITPLHARCLTTPRETSCDNRLQSSPAKISSISTQKQSKDPTISSCNEQCDITFKLDHLKNKLFTTKDLAEPLINLVPIDEPSHVRRNLEGGPVVDLLAMNEEEIATTSPIQLLEPRRGNNTPPPQELSSNLKVPVQTMTLGIGGDPDLLTTS